MVSTSLTASAQIPIPYLPGDPSRDFSFYKLYFYSLPLKLKPFDAFGIYGLDGLGGGPRGLGGLEMDGDGPRGLGGLGVGRLIVAFGFSPRIC